MFYNAMLATFLFLSYIMELYQKSNSIDLKAACISTLGEFEDPELIGFFENLLQDSPPSIKIHAIKALAKLGSESSLPVLTETVHSENFWVAKHSIEALNEYGVSGIRELIKILEQTRSEMTRDLILENLDE